jgi:hypothetical protein
MIRLVKILCLAGLAICAIYAASLLQLFGLPADVSGIAQVIGYKVFAVIQVLLSLLIAMPSGLVFLFGVFSMIGEWRLLVFGKKAVGKVLETKKIFDPAFPNVMMEYPEIRFTDHTGTQHVIRQKLGLAPAAHATGNTVPVRYLAHCPENATASDTSTRIYAPWLFIGIGSAGLYIAMRVWTAHF